MPARRAGVLRRLALLCLVVGALVLGAWGVRSLVVKRPRSALLPPAGKGLGGEAPFRFAVLGDNPTPAELRARYEHSKGFSLDSDQARLLLARYPGGEGTRRYYQDAAIRAVIEKVARFEPTRSIQASVARAGDRRRQDVHRCQPAPPDRSPGDPAGGGDDDPQDLGELANGKMGKGILLLTSCSAMPILRRTLPWER